MIYLHSSAIYAVDYNDGSWTLYIQFREGETIYPFYHVPSEIFHGLIGATDSHGRFYNQHIRGRYSGYY